MKKVTTSLTTLLIFISSYAGIPVLQGYEYGNVAMPDGTEWESVERLALNKEQPKAYYFSFQNLEQARKVLPENSAYWQSLNGTWKFHFAKTPDERPKTFYQTDYNTTKWDDITVPSNWNVEGIRKDGTLKYGVPIYVNQPVIFYHQVKVNDWRNGVMRTPPTNWTTYKYRNEVGSYKREFTVPKSWEGREVYVSFDGVDSFFYLWINGQYVGFSKNSRNTANFNISKHLKKGTNTVSVEVYRSSDGSFLEAQDMFRLPGIFRTVALYSTPKLHISDLKVVPDLDKNYQNGKLTISANIKNLDKKTAKKHKLVYTLYANKLYSDDNSPVQGAKAVLELKNIAKQSTANSVTTTLRVTQPSLWSAEIPNRYVLVAQLKDKRNRTIETVSTYVGFRKVEIKDTKAEDDEFGLAGRYYYINGKTVKLKGVNRHETNPTVGHAITRKMMEKEMMLLKRANINHVRNSHYPDDPYWYYLCNKFGIYLEDEANIESHEYYYGDASLSHPKEWKAAHVARVMEMVHANINHPAIVIWSLGNEAGPGNNFVAAYNALKQEDVSRPVQYERNNAIVDMGSNQYPSISWTHEAVKGNYNIKYPFHISEYAHSMGNACGNLKDYWEAIESTNFFMGGAIWDWIDQALYNYTPEQERYLAYGGDFGDTPNDGQFVMNGIIFADYEPKPQYYEVKKVYQNIGITANDVKNGTFNIFNKNYFIDLSKYEMSYKLIKNGEIVEQKTVAIPEVKPRRKATVTLPYNYATFDESAEYHVVIQLSLKNDEPWAEKGYVQANEQILIKRTGKKPTVAEQAVGNGALTQNETNNRLTVSGDKFNVSFDKTAGTIFSLNYNGNTIIENGNGPKLNALRAFVNNDNWTFESWFAMGLHNLQHTVKHTNTMLRADGSLAVMFTIESQAPNAAKIHGGTASGKNRVEELTDRPFGENDFKFTTNQIFTIYKDGSIELQAAVATNKPNAVLPRLGYQMVIPKTLEYLTYYGRGPVENYPDRKSGQFVGIYSKKVADTFVNFPKPQDMGNHQDTRWIALNNGIGEGVLFVSTDKMSVQALQYSAMDMTLAGHPYQLPAAGDTYLNLDMSITGLGGNSCGQGGPLAFDQVKVAATNFGFMIRPINKTNLLAQANVSQSGEMPITISRTRIGELSFSSPNTHSEIMYSLNGKKPQQYNRKAIPFRNGGTVSAWFKESPEFSVTTSFPFIEQLPISVISTSSEETGVGNATHLTDGDPNTIWHTMYSVTVAKHPHWVDLDMGEVKMLKGFTYLPRRGGGNGNIKDYTIQVSIDGKTWTAPILKAAFANNAEEKKVMLDKSVQARYIRFTALSEQHGQDFASGAELTIIADK